MSDKMLGDQASRKCGFVTLFGATNAGKSTLLNRLVGAKVSIVSHKVQTTRALVRGLTLVDDTQIVFMDTPGIFKPKRMLDRAMVQTAWSGAFDGDVLCLLVDVQKGFSEDVKAILERLKGDKRPLFLVLNKIDLVRKEKLLSLTEKITQSLDFHQVFMISALSGKGVDVLLASLAKLMPQGAWHYPEDQMSDAPMRVLAAEITREKLYERLHEELPYASMVETAQWKTLKDGSIRIEQMIIVERDSQKKIVLGKEGQAIKWISTQARQEISAVLECKVHLFLFVKVRQNWSRDVSRYQEMGLEIPKT